jgi:hypothetical protein
MPQPRRGSRRSGDAGDLTPDALAPQPGEEGARLLVGILGEGPDTDTVRLYLDLEFRKSYDIPTEAIVRREKLTPEQSSLGVESSAMWVRAETTLKLHQTETRKVEDEFLAGDFTAPGSFQPRPEVPGIPLPEQIRTLDSCGIVACGPRTVDSCGIVACAPRTIESCGIVPCGSAVDACPSRVPDWCQPRTPDCPFSPLPRCRTPLPIRCWPQGTDWGPRCTVGGRWCFISNVQAGCGFSEWNPCIPRSEIDACPSALGCF